MESTKLLAMGKPNNMDDDSELGEHPRGRRIMRVHKDVHSDNGDAMLDELETAGGGDNGLGALEEDEPVRSTNKRASLSTSQRSRQSDSQRRSTRKRFQFEGVGASAASTREKITIAAVVVHLFKGNIGPGAMSLPYGFSRAGVTAAPVFFVIVALLSTYNMDLLLHCKRVLSPHAPMSFGEVGGKILGRKGKLFIDVFLVGTQLGICCVYFTFVATNIHVVLPKRVQEAVHERQLILMIFPVVLMLSWIRTLKKITPFSGIANVFVFLGISIVFYYSLTYDPKTPRAPPVHVDWSAFPEFYGTAVYSFEGIGLILPIQNEMSEPALFPRVLAACMMAILVLFLFLGEIPTLAFGQIDNGSMTATLREYCDGWPVTMSNVMLACACLLSFPIQFYPAVEVLEKSLRRSGTLMRPTTLHERDARHEARMRRLRKEMEAEWEQRASRLSEQPPASLSGIDLLTIQSAAKAPHSGRGSSVPAPPQSNNSVVSTTSTVPPIVEHWVCSMSQYECNRTLFRSMLCTILMAIAICVPDVGLLISLFGAVGSSMLAIILPPYMYLKLTKCEVSRFSLFLHGGIIAIGILCMIAGTVQAFRDIIKTFT